MRIVLPRAVGGRSDLGCHPCSKYVCSRCHKATPRALPLHAMPCHAMPRLRSNAGSYAVGELLNTLISHIVSSFTSVNRPPHYLHLGRSGRGPAARQDRRALAPPSAPPTVATYLIDAAASPPHSFAFHGHDHGQQAGMSASSVFLRRVAWRGIGAAVGRGGESSLSRCAASLRAWDGDGGWVHWQRAESQGPRV